MDISGITSLISALRAETGKDSISPENVGYIMQQIVDALPRGQTVIVFFDEVSASGTVKMMSSNVPVEELVIAWVESAGKFGARLKSSGGMVPVNPEYYANWLGREKWCGTDGKPYADTLYVCDGTIYVASEDLSGLVALLPQELEAWRDSISAAVSELQRLVDEGTGAIIPDLDIGFSVDLI